jgi:hypothetical protein
MPIKELKANIVAKKPKKSILSAQTRSPEV